MGMNLEYWSQEILRHIPLVTSIGMGMALTFGVAWFAKRWNAAALLGLCCMAYAVTPFLPSMTR